MLDHLYGRRPPSLMAKAESLQEFTPEKKLVICDGSEEPIVIRSASDLLVWLVSHPLPSSHKPRHLGNSRTLLGVLTELGKEHRVTDPKKYGAK